MKYIIGADLTISVQTVVEADNPEEAMALAAMNQPAELCNYCASISGVDEWVTGGELDGEPFNLRVISPIEEPAPAPTPEVLATFIAGEDIPVGSIVRTARDG